MYELPNKPPSYLIYQSLVKLTTNLFCFFRVLSLKRVCSQFSYLADLFFCFTVSIFSATIQAISAYLDAFQKIADAATNSRGKFFEFIFDHNI